MVCHYCLYTVLVVRQFLSQWIAMLMIFELTPYDIHQALYFSCWLAMLAKLWSFLDVLILETNPSYASHIQPSVS